jgi:hypothetical protein
VKCYIGEQFSSAIDLDRRRAKLNLLRSTRLAIPECLFWFQPCLLPNQALIKPFDIVPFLEQQNFSLSGLQLLL